MTDDQSSEEFTFAFRTTNVRSRETRGMVITLFAPTLGKALFALRAVINSELVLDQVNQVKSHDTDSDGQ